MSSWTRLTLSLGSAPFYAGRRTCHSMPKKSLVELFSIPPLLWCQRPQTSCPPFMPDLEARVFDTILSSQPKTFDTVVSSSSICPPLRSLCRSGDPRAPVPSTSPAFQYRSDRRPFTRDGEPRFGCHLNAFKILFPHPAPFNWCQKDQETHVNFYVGDHRCVFFDTIPSSQPKDPRCDVILTRIVRRLRSLCRFGRQKGLVSLGTVLAMTFGSAPA